MYVNSTDFQFDPPNMMEVAPIFAGEIFADKINDFNETLTYGTLIDSSMNGICMFIFLLNWVPRWIISYGLNPLMSFFTKDKIYREFAISHNCK